VVLRSKVVAAVGVAVLAATPMAAITVVTPPAASACAPGETGVIYGCAPFCLPGRALDTQTGVCVADPRVPPPPPPAPPLSGPSQ
jgi:hypothetical protein